MVPLPRWCRLPHACDRPRIVQPALAAGEVLLFDWRIWHRGLANHSDRDRPVAYVTYARRGVRGASYKDELPSLAAWQAVWDGAGPQGCDDDEEDEDDDSDAPGLDDFEFDE